MTQRTVTSLLERVVAVVPITIAAAYAATSMLIHNQNTCLYENKQFDSMLTHTQVDLDVGPYK